MKTPEERRDRLLNKKLNRRERYLKTIKWCKGQLKKLDPRQDDPQTASEKSWRDKKLEPLSYLLWKLSISANFISYLGFLLVTAYNILMWLGFYKFAFVMGTVGAATDFIDGPRARFKDPETGKDSVTGWGTFLDHSRDFYFAFSFGWDAFFRFGTTAPIEIFLVIFVLLSYFVILAATVFEYQLWGFPTLATVREKFRISYWKNVYGKISEFSLSELQTSFYGRAQFFCLVAGVITLFLGKFAEIEFLIHFSYVAFGTEIAFAVKNLIDEHIFREEE